MRLVVLFAAALSLAACQTSCPDAAAPSVTNTGFTCEDGSVLQVAFSRQPDSARIVQEGYAPLNLPARITGSGYRYADGGAELRGRGTEARWTRPGAAETICHEAH